MKAYFYAYDFSELEGKISNGLLFELANGVQQWLIENPDQVFDKFDIEYDEEIKTYLVTSTFKSKHHATRKR